MVVCWVRVIFSWFGDWDDYSLKSVFREIVWPPYVIENLQKDCERCFWQMFQELIGDFIWASSCVFSFLYWVFQFCDRERGVVVFPVVWCEVEFFLLRNIFIFLEFGEEKFDEEFWLNSAAIWLAISFLSVVFPPFGVFR